MRANPATGRPDGARQEAKDGHGTAKPRQRIQTRVLGISLSALRSPKEPTNTKFWNLQAATLRGSILDQKKMTPGRTLAPAVATGSQNAPRSAKPKKLQDKPRIDPSMRTPARQASQNLRVAVTVSLFARENAALAPAVALEMSPRAARRSFSPP